MKKQLLSAAGIMILITFHQNTEYKKGTPGMSKILWAPVDFFDVNGIPEPTSTYGTAGATATIDPANFTFKSTKGWIDLKNDLYKGSELDFKSVGDESSPGFASEIKGRQNGMSAAQIEAFRDYVGTPGIAVIQDSSCNTNEWKVLGCDCNHAYFTVEGKSGTKGGSEAKAMNFSIKAQCVPATAIQTGTWQMLP